MTKVNEASETVLAMRASCRLVSTIAAGGDAMRAAGTAYLPKFPMENAEDYEARKDTSWLFNGVKKARDDAAGKVFEKPAVLNDQEGDLYGWCQNIDMEGRDLSNFAKDAFTQAVECGITWLLVDAPERNGAVTQGEAKAKNLRPFMSHIGLDSVLGWQWGTVDNMPTLTHFRFMESVAKPDRTRFSDDEIPQARTYDLEGGKVVIRLYREGKKGDFEQFGEDRVTDMTEIQVVPIYTGRTGFMTAKTTLDDIAEVNRAHWQRQSDKSSCLHKALAPMLLFKGIDVGEDGKLVSSAGYAFHSSAENASIEWSEITGSGIAHAVTELDAMERQMQWLGLQLMSEKVGTTATESNIEEGKSVTRLRMWADDLKDALEIAMGWMAEMGGIPDADTSVDVHKNFSTMSHLAFSDVRDMYSAGVISRTAYTAEAQRRGILAEEYDAEADAELIEGETMFDAIETETQEAA